MNKKKFLGGLKLLLLLLFFMVFATYSNNCKAYTTYNGRPQLNSGEFLEIIDEIGLNQYWSGDIVETARNTWNNWARNYSGDFILDNVAFFRNGTPNTEIGWFLSNGTFSNTLDFYALLPYNGQISANDVPITSSTTALQVEGYTSWIEDSNENRTGMNLFRPTGFFLNLSSANLVTTRESSTIIVSGRNSSNSTVAITIDGITVFTPQLVTFNRYYTIASHTDSSGYDWFFLTHHLQFTNESAPTPTPTPSGEPSPEPTTTPSSIVDLSETNSKIDDVNESVQEVNSSVQEVNSSVQELINQQSGDTNKIVESLTSIPSGDDFQFFSSGELVGSMGIANWGENRKVSASDNFWITITNELYSCLTDDVRYYVIDDFFGSPFTLDNQFLMVENDFIIDFLHKVEIVGFVLIEYKLIRKIVNMFSSGVFSQILRAYSKIDISNLF